MPKLSKHDHQNVADNFSNKVLVSNCSLNAPVSNKTSTAAITISIDWPLLNARSCFTMWWVHKPRPITTSIQSFIDESSQKSSSMVSINFRTLSSFIVDDNVGDLREYLQQDRVDIDDRDDVKIAINWIIRRTNTSIKSFKHISWNAVKIEQNTKCDVNDLSRRWLLTRFLGFSF